MKVSKDLHDAARARLLTYATAHDDSNLELALLDNMQSNWAQKKIMQIRTTINKVKQAYAQKKGVLENWYATSLKPLNQQLMAIMRKKKGHIGKIRKKAAKKAGTV